MDHATIFLAGVYLMPLAFVSFVSAWTHSHRPALALTLTVISGALLAFVAFDRPGGLYPVSELPAMTTQFVARVIALF